MRTAEIIFHDVLSVSYSVCIADSIGYRFSVVNGSEGSCFLEIGGTKVLCSVFGPRPKLHTGALTNGTLECSVSLSSWMKNDTNTVQLSHVNSRDVEQERKHREMELSRNLAESITIAVVLDHYIGMEISLFVQVIQDDGAVLPAMICAASAALSSAGIEMYDLVLSSQVLIDEEGMKVVDPTLQEMEQSKKSIVVAFMPTLGQITCLHGNVQSSVETIEELLQFAVEVTADMKNELVVALKSLV